MFKKLGIGFICLLGFMACKKSAIGEYSGTASVTRGLASTTNENLYSKGVRIARIGSITADDKTV